MPEGPCLPLARFVLRRQAAGEEMGGRPQVDGMGNAPTIEFDEEGGVVGRLSRGLCAGMTLGEVVALLGQPDIVTRGPAGREAWVWDGVPSARLEAGAPGPGLLAGIRRTAHRDQGALTVVVRFDELQQVSSVSLLACR